MTHAQCIHTNINMESVIDSLRQQIASCEATLQTLRHHLAEAEHTHSQQQKLLGQKKQRTDPLRHDMNFGVPEGYLSEVLAVLEQDTHAPESGDGDEQRKWPLEKHEYRRYGRQLIMPEIGLRG